MTDAWKVSHPSLHSPGPGQGQLLRDKTGMEGVKEDGEKGGYALLDPAEARSCPGESGACEGSWHQRGSHASWSNSWATKPCTWLKGDGRSPAERGRQWQQDWQRWAHAIGMSFPATCLQFPEAQKRTPRVQTQR